MSISSKWRSPSNIALVKYWGKKPGQIPSNASISFTLDACFTETEVRLVDRQNDAEYDFDLWLDGEPKESFKPKIEKFFRSIARELPLLNQYRLEIRTHNSFPHSSGIASSASGLSALALCLLDLATRENPMEESAFYQKASEWARLGSGSACRSVYGGLVAWGEHAAIAGSSDRFGVDCSAAVHPDFLDYRDFVLLVDEGKKSVSSSLGHGLMDNHPYAQGRLKQAERNLSDLMQKMKGQNFHELGAIAEREALSLHALMMSSDPAFILMKPNTLSVIDLIWQFRKNTDIPAYFTLDAGANIHLLCPGAHEHAVQNFVEQEVSRYLKEGRYICDRVGRGPVKL